MQPPLSLFTFPEFECTRPARKHIHEVPAGPVSCSHQVSVGADIRRLFVALTVPEYMEAWLTLPGHRTACSTVASRNCDDYAVEHSCGGTLSVLISGRYKLCRRRAVTFSWRVEGDRYVPKSEVDIRLRGDFDRTTIILRHSGFTNRHDLAWYKALWTVSMDRLAALYGSPDRVQPNSEKTRPRPTKVRQDIPDMSPR